MEVDPDRPKPFPNKLQKYKSTKKYISTKVLITQPFFELQTPDFAWKFIKGKRGKGEREKGKKGKREKRKKGKREKGKKGKRGKGEKGKREKGEKGKKEKRGKGEKKQKTIAPAFST